MTPQEIIARELAKMDGYDFDDAAEEFSPGAEIVSAALTAAGYSIVPTEPTINMISAWYRCKNGANTRRVPVPEDTSDYAAYRAMITAAPKEGQG